jgi:hypothetical protein
VRLDGYWGYITTSGTIYIAPQFDSASPFSCGIAVVSSNQTEHKFIDKLGKTVIAGPFAEARSCTDSLFFARKRDEFNYRLFNYSGKEIDVKKTYKEVFPFKNGCAIVRNAKGIWTIINTKGEVLYEDADCSHIAGPSEGMYAFRKNGKWGFIDSTFKVIVPPILDSYTPFKEGYSRVQEYNGNWMLLNKTGKALKWSKGYKAIGKFEGGLLPVKNGNLWGYININGELVIPMSFLAARPFKEGVAMVKSDQGLWGYIGNKGEWIMKPEFIGAKECKNGFMLVKYLNGSWGYRTATGGKLPETYGHAFSFEKIYDSGEEEEENTGDQ